MLNFFNNSLCLLTFMTLVYALFLLYQVTQPLPATDVMAHQRINQISEVYDREIDQLKQEHHIRLIRLESVICNRQPRQRVVQCP